MEQNCPTMGRTLCAAREKPVFVFLRRKPITVRRKFAPLRFGVKSEMAVLEFRRALRICRQAFIS